MPDIPPVTSVSAPSNIARMTAAYHPLHGYPLANNPDLNVVLSDVAEEDTDLEDGHTSSLPVCCVFNFYFFPFIRQVSELFMYEGLRPLITLVCLVRMRVDIFVVFLADRTNGRPVGTSCRLSVGLAAVCL